MDYLRQIQRGLDYIEAHLAEDIAPGDVWRHAGISQRHFQREKLRQALELMQLGIALQRRKLRATDPVASEQEIDARLLAWMSAPR